LFFMHVFGIFYLECMSFVVSNNATG